MPSITVSKKDLENLVGKKLEKEKLRDILQFAKVELDGVEEDKLELAVSDSNRPDLLSAEGIARELRGKLGIEKGIPEYKVKKGKTEITIDASVESCRPFIACCVARNVKITNEILVQLIQLQEKMALTHGRRRKHAGLGLYDFDKIKSPLVYRAVSGNELKFTPLDFSESLTPNEILERHPKGKAFGQLIVNGQFPVIIDSNNQVASMPPIINSEETGRVTEATKNIFIEATALSWEEACTQLNIMAMALADRGAELEGVTVHFPKTKMYSKVGTSKLTPHFGTEKITLELDQVNQMIGEQWSAKQVQGLIEKCRMNASISGKKIAVEYPSYRQDILHPVDVIEDIVIAYGFKNLKPIKPELVVQGSLMPESKTIELVKEICIGLGLQEVMTLILTSSEKQKNLMNLDSIPALELSNPVSQSYTLFRPSIIPELMEFLSKNKNVTYPQHIFEIGKCVEKNDRAPEGVEEKVKLGIAIAKDFANFNDMKSILNSITEFLNQKITLKPIVHLSFIAGRVAEVQVGEKKGLIGELHPLVLDNFGIEFPVIVLELEII